MIAFRARLMPRSQPDSHEHEDSDMNLTDLLFLSIPAALAVFKLAVLMLATVWAMNSLFKSRGLLPDVQRQPLRSRALRS